MFLTKDDLGNVIYNYQINQITEGNEDIVTMALVAAQEEAKSYLTPNNKIDFLDGRLVYDVEVIFSKTGTERNALLVMHCVTIAKWHIVQLCNADVIYEHAKERYDRATNWFDKLSKGDVTLTSLPILETETQQTNQGIHYGSRQKYNHDF